MNQKLIEAMARGIYRDEFDNLPQYMDSGEWEMRSPPYFEAAQAALQAIEQAGFAVVPAEPNNTGLIAMATAHDKTEEGGKRVFHPLAAAYRAMITAAKGE